MTEQQYTTPEPTSSGYGAGSQPVQSGQPMQQPVQTTALPPKKKKGKKGKIALVIVLVLVLSFGGFIGINLYWFYQPTVIRDYTYVSSEAERLCHPEVEKTPSSDVYDAKSYLFDKFGIQIVPPSYIKKGDKIIKNITNLSAAVSFYDENKPQFTNDDLVKFGIKPLVDDLAVTIAKCDSVDSDDGDHYKTEEEARSALKQLGDKSIEQYKELKSTFIKYVQDLIEQNKSSNPESESELREYAAKFGLTDFSTDVELCYKGIENQKAIFDVAACVSPTDIHTIRFDLTSHKHSDTIKHEIAHHIANLMCRTAEPYWPDLKNSSFTGESLANAFAINYLGADPELYERSVLLSAPLKTSRESMDENWETLLYFKDYERHPSDDDAAARVYRGECVDPLIGGY